MFGIENLAKLYKDKDNTPVIFVPDVSFDLPLITGLQKTKGSNLDLALYRSSSLLVQHSHSIKVYHSAYLMEYFNLSVPPRIEDLYKIQDGKIIDIQSDLEKFRKIFKKDANANSSNIEKDEIHHDEVRKYYKRLHSIKDELNSGNAIILPTLYDNLYFDEIRLSFSGLSNNYNRNGMKEGWDKIAEQNAKHLINEEVGATPKHISKYTNSELQDLFLYKTSAPDKVVKDVIMLMVNGYVRKDAGEHFAAAAVFDLHQHIKNSDFPNKKLRVIFQYNAKDDRGHFLKTFHNIAHRLENNQPPFYLAGYNSGKKPPEDFDPKSPNYSSERATKYLDQDDLQVGFLTVSGYLEVMAKSFVKISDKLRTEIKFIKGAESFKENGKSCINPNFSEVVVRPILENYVRETSFNKQLTYNPDYDYAKDVSAKKCGQGSREMSDDNGPFQKFMDREISKNFKGITNFALQQKTNVLSYLNFFKEEAEAKLNLYNSEISQYIGFSEASKKSASEFR